MGNKGGVTVVVGKVNGRLEKYWVGGAVFASLLRLLFSDWDSSKCKQCINSGNTVYCFLDQ